MVRARCRGRRSDELKAAESVDMRLEPSTTIYMTLLKPEREPFSNLKARQAASMAIDNKAIAANHHAWLCRTGEHHAAGQRRFP
ncbi:hypothetical protein ACOJBM_41265 [Rhizobium beringeri]